MLVVVVTCYITGYIVFVYGALRASRTIHRDLVMSVLGTTLRYVDVRRRDLRTDERGP